MSEALALSPQGGRLRALVLAGIAIAAAAAAFGWFGLGLLSMPGLLLLLATLAGGGLAIAALGPELLVVAAPALMPLPLLWIVFPYELAFVPLAFFFLLHALRTRPAWLTRLEDFEVWNLLLLAWAFYTGFWCDELAVYGLGVRKLAMGALALWVSYRLAHRVPRIVFEIGLVANATLLCVAALARRNALGTTIKGLDRASATDLGWGTANAIATLLLLLGPILLWIATNHRDRWLRIGTWPALVLSGFMQLVIASRAAAVLFAGGLLAQVSTGWHRRSWIAFGVTLAAIVGFAASPLGAPLLARFTSPRELGSVVVRLLYFREAWHRTVDNLPWGIGLNQGFFYPDHLQAVDPHNYWLMLSSELGLPGVALWAVVLVMLWRRVRRVGRTPGWEGLGRALQISFWLSQLHTLVEPTFQGPQYQFLYFWTIGGFLGYHAVAVANHSRTTSELRSGDQ